MPRKPDPDARRKLLAAARAAFAEVGVDAARIEDVSRAAGYSKGAFYLHFESKEEAFREIVTAFFAVMQDLAQQRHEAAAELVAEIGPLAELDLRMGSPRLARWREFDHTHSVTTLQALWRHRDVLRCVLEHKSGGAALLDRFVDLARASLAAQLQVAGECGGIRRDLDPELVSELLIGLYLQLGRRMARLNARPDLDAWARHVDTLVREGISARDLVSDHAVSQGAK